MRVMVTLNGRRQVTEVLEFEPIDDKTVMLWTAEHLLDIKLTNIDSTTADDIANKLLIYGYMDLTSYHAEYDEDPEDDEFEYEAECPDCGAVIYVDEKAYARGQMNCPQCGEVLEFDGIEGEEGLSNNEPEGKLVVIADTAEGKPREPEKKPFGGLFSRKTKSRDPWER